MILPIILLILIVLIISLIICFLFYIFLPSIKIDEKLKDDPIIPRNNKNFLIAEDVYFEKSDYKAMVMCSCEKETKLRRSVFNPSYSCFMAKTNLGTGLDCKYACIGLGDCLKVCPQQAIILQNQTAVITNNCCSCGKCIEICPQNIIQLVPRNTKKVILCNNTSHDLTSCNKYLSEENVEWKEKKDFKLWSYCYKIITRIIKF